MTNAAFFVAAALGAPLLYGPKAEPSATSASGDDGRVRVTVSVYRATVAPGEDVRIYASFKLLVDGPLRFPQHYHQPLGFLYLRTPADKVVMYPQRGISPKSYRPLEAADYRRPRLFKKGTGGSVINTAIPMVDPSPGWFDPHSLQPVRPNLRVEGVYEAWVKYTVPKVEGVPDDAWHGTVETKRIRFKVREIPVAKRRDKPTAEQIAHLKAYMKYMEASAGGKNVKPETRKAVEMPYWLSLERRLQWALRRTENEGFARYAVALLRKHQPKNKDAQYPRWWGNVSFFVNHSRAYLRDYRVSTFRIFGPYLDDYATLAAVELERELDRPNDEVRSLDAGYYLNLLLDYVERKPKSPIRKQLEKLARRHCKIPANAKPGDHKTRDRLAISWRILRDLRILRDGMLFADTKKILGEPTFRKDNLVVWNYTTGSRRAEPGVAGRIVIDGGRKKIAFVRYAN